MNYITDGTFYFYLLIIGGAIGAVYYILHKKIEKLTNKNKIIDETLADFFFLIGILYKMMGVIEDHSDEQTVKEMDDIFTTDDNEIQKILKKYNK